ncbi:bacteriohopanetetrol glucosamine biosynthesis glycosyltransferase HpnI [Candidatus Igneacidithiobacillus taiwanensis]|uniref:bacteriohopanetetrol glucosamine biosynthesis glycosyltransferase HpnI n=1 Tax=Candidatus Igneacidithiobacillus taiwanensis TaxID=1945924 RepID=UPI00289E8D86|nr:bacteriohopanetetrol glucosamine biosynthesis glycosyltransferase HpnI [Candidatus Igneacidithiobacillus taiwanensis]
MAYLTDFLAVLAVFSAIYWAMAWWQIERWRPRLPEDGRADGPLAEAPGVSILKPLHGVEPELLENLHSFLAQDYPRYEVVCGVQDPTDPVLALLQQLPVRANLHIVVHQQDLGGNPKVSNLAGIYAQTHYPLLVLADADIRVGPAYLVQLVRELQRPGVGVVSCLYRPRVAGGFWSQVLGVQIQEHFLPSVRLANSLGPNVYCAGASIAIRREVFEACGGFPAIAPALADDYAIGASVRAQGYRSVVSDYVVETIVAEPGFASFYRHALRWARTTRTVQPWGHAFSFLTYPLPLSLLLAAFLGKAGAALLVLVLVLRLVYHWRIVRKLRSPLPLSAVLLADVLGFWIWAHAQVASSVHWRGRNFSIDAHGQLHDGVER